MTKSSRDNSNLIIITHLQPLLIMQITQETIFLIENLSFLKIPKKHYNQHNYRKNNTDSQNYSKFLYAIIINFIIFSPIFINKNRNFMI